MNTIFCNPIILDDDEEIDLRMEEIWELARSRARVDNNDKNGKSSRKKTTLGRKNANTTGKQGRSLSMASDPKQGIDEEEERRPEQMILLKNNRRAMSAGRMDNYERRVESRVAGRKYNKSK